jgi:hypothetical protein
MTDEELKAAIAAKTAPKVTLEMMEARIATVSYFSGNQSRQVNEIDYIDGLPETLTLCSIELDNGYSVRGESACVSIENFDYEIGKKLAYKAAVAKLWPLFGFLLAEQLHQEQLQAAHIPGEE